MTGRILLGGTVAAAALVAAPTAGATNECRGFVICAPVAGPWVVLPMARTLQRPKVQYQLTCPRGFVVGGVDAELSDRAIDVAFLGSSGSPIQPGVTTSRSVVFLGSYVGAGARAPTFRPHAGCIPASGGGERTPTGLAAVFPPGRPTVRRVVTTRIVATRQIVAACRLGERLVDWYWTRGFATPAPPSAALVQSLTGRARAYANHVVVFVHAGRGEGVVQVGAVCAGGP